MAAKPAVCVSLSAVLQNVYTCRLFKDFLAAERMDHTLVFIVEVEELKSVSNVVLQKVCVEGIYNRYLHPLAMSPVPVAPTTMNIISAAYRIRGSIAEAPVALYAQAALQVLEFLETQPYARFQVCDDRMMKVKKILEHECRVVAHDNGLGSTSSRSLKYVSAKVNERAVLGNTDVNARDTADYCSHDVTAPTPLVEFTTSSRLASQDINRTETITSATASSSQHMRWNPLPSVISAAVHYSSTAKFLSSSCPSNVAATVAAAAPPVPHKVHHKALHKAPLRMLLQQQSFMRCFKEFCIAS
jgi:hypothetical protein